MKMRKLMFLLFVLIAVQCHAVPQSFAQTKKDIPPYREYFRYVEYVSCYDGDTCRFNIHNVPDIFGHRMPVRLRGIDTPEIRGKCAEEKEMAYKARDFIRSVLNNGKRIELRNLDRGKYFRIVADIYVDDVNVAELMIEKGFGKPYEENIDWCS